jgi:hypothetical protein
MTVQYSPISLLQGFTDVESPGKKEIIARPLVAVNEEQVRTIF